MPQATRAVTNKVQQTKSQVAQWMSRKAGPAREALVDARIDAVEGWRRFQIDLTEAVTQYPLSAVAISVGIGLLIGRAKKKVDC